MWPMKILRFTVLAQVLLLLVATTGLADGVPPPPSHTRTTRQVIPLAQGTLNNLLNSMSEGAKAVRLVVSRPLQRLRNLRLLPGGAATTPTTARPAALNRPQKNVYDLSEVHYHYDDYGNRIENPKEYLKGFKNSYSPTAQHSHTHTGDSSVLPANVLKEIELKEEYKIGKDVDTGSFSYEYGAPHYQSSFHNNQFNSFGSFETQTTHDDDWTPLNKAKPASSLHTSAVTGSDDFFGSQSSKFLAPRPIKNYRSIKHYDSDRPSTSYSFHHFASPNADYTVDTKEKAFNSFGSPVGSSSMKVSQTQNFDQFYDYFDKKFKDHHVSESQIQAIAEAVVQEKPQAAPLVQKPTTTAAPVTTTTTAQTTQRTTTSRRPTTRSSPPRAAPKVHERENKQSTNTERPNYPEYFFAKDKPELKQKFIPVRNIRDEEELFKGSMAQFPMPPAKFIPQTPKFPMQTKEPLHIVVGQPVIDKAGLKAKEKFRKQMEEKKLMAFSTRKRYPTVTTRSPMKPESITLPSAGFVPMDSTTMAVPMQFSTDGYVHNEVSPVDTERKYPKKVEITTPKARVRPHAQVEAAKPSTSSSTTKTNTQNHNRGSTRGRGSIKFGARL